MEKNNDLPLGWVCSPFEDLAIKLKAGGTPSTKVTKYYVNGKIPFVKIDDMTNSKKYLNKTKILITEEGLKNSSAWKVPENSILYSMYASYGLPIINTMSVATSQAIIAYVPPHDCIDLNYIYYYLESIKTKLRPKGTTQANLNAEIIRNIVVKVAPSDEQKRIVSKIEEIFSKLDSAKQSLENIKIQLKQYKQSLLKHAFEGNLTEKWREKNNVGLSFKKESLENLILFSKNGFTGKPTEKGIPRLGIETITGTNSIHVDETKHKFIEVPTSKIEVYKAKKGDLFVCRQNGNKNYVGKSAVFNDLIKPMIFSDSLIQLRLKIELIVPEYLAFFINSELGRNQIERFCSTTAGNYSINGTNLKKIIIEFPSFLEQKQIISKIEEGFSLIENSEKIIELSLKNIDVLRKSILKQAFEGKLVPQNPNDESAEILLQRIKKERQKINTESKK